MPPNESAEAVTTTAGTGCCDGSAHCGPQAADGPAPGVTPREITIDFLYFDLNTCERCVATGDTLDEALMLLAPVLSRSRVSVTVNKVNITTAELAGQYRFVSSPTIRVDGVDICAEIAESHCADCSDLSGCATDCRVFVHEGREYEQPPAAMIIDGILRVLYGQPTPADPEPYVMPQNLVDYFHGATSSTRIIQVFEPALCGNTGVCGPGPAQELVTFAADLDHAKRRGAQVTRHDLANDPRLFADTEPVRQFLDAAGSDGLPLTLVDGVVVLTGRHPSRAELLRYARLSTDEPTSTPASSGCGCGSRCDC